MATARFASHIDRLNRAVHVHLSDAVGRLDGQDVQGIFHDAYLAVGDVATTGPALELDNSHVAGIVPEQSQFLHGTPFAGQLYTVTRVEPDGVGRSVLRLRKA